jgi:hypothetical protein
VTFRRLALHFRHPLAAFALAAFSSTPALAQHDQMHAKTSQPSKTKSELIQTIREANDRFRDVNQAEAEDYTLMFGCVSGGDFGAMGLHYVKGAYIGDDVLDPTHPEIVIYEATPSGRLKLTGVDFLVFADVWEAKHPGTTPQIEGQLMHLFEAPNRFGLPPFYTLHVWAWKDNPNGAFVNWHPNVKCDTYNPQK